MLLVPCWPPRPLAPWKNTGSRRQHCPAGGCVCPGARLLACAQSALLSPPQLVFALPRGEGARVPPRSLGRSILSADACPIPSLCPTRRAALLTGWARGLLPHLPRCLASPSPIPWDSEGNIHQQWDVLRAQEGKQPRLAGRDEVSG